jgi:N-acetylmuramoyl-L-alanine amidase
MFGSLLLGWPCVYAAGREHWAETLPAKQPTAPAKKMTPPQSSSARPLQNGHIMVIKGNQINQNIHNGNIYNNTSNNQGLTSQDWARLSKYLALLSQAQQKNIQMTFNTMLGDVRADVRSLKEAENKTQNHLQNLRMSDTERASYEEQLSILKNNLAEKEAQLAQFTDQAKQPQLVQQIAQKYQAIEAQVNQLPDDALKHKLTHLLSTGQLNQVLSVIEKEEAALKKSQDKLAYLATVKVQVYRLQNRQPEAELALQRVRALNPKLVVVLDPGHGGKDLGGSRDNIYEKDLNMLYALRIKTALEDRGVSVLMTRTGDIFTPLPDIVTFTNRVQPRAFLSVHTNASPNPGQQGTETYYYTPQSLALANSVNSRMAQKLGGVSRLSVRKAMFYTIHHTTAPAILLEMGYLSNPTERQRLQTDAHQQAMAESVAEGILDYLNQPVAAQHQAQQPAEETPFIEPRT